MNKNLYRTFLIPFLFSTLILFTIQLQTTLWFGFFGSTPAPMLWTTSFVYLMTNRNHRTRAAWLFFFLFVVCSYSVALPLHVFLSLVSMTYLIRFIQKRFSAIDTSDLIAFSLMSTICFPLIYSFFSYLHYDYNYDFWSHVLTAILTLPFIPIILYVCRRIDSILNVEGEGILVVRL